MIRNDNCNHYAKRGNQKEKGKGVKSSFDPLQFNYNLLNLIDPPRQTTTCLESYFKSYDDTAYRTVIIDFKLPFKYCT